MKITKTLKKFIKSEQLSGVLLIFWTLISLRLSNSAVGASYHHIFENKLYGQSIEFWINDGLMVIFFLLIGLELKREIYEGELSNIEQALFPIFGAIGGILAPAFIFILFNFGTPTQSGAGIPMATDIAFALGVLSLLGKKVPVSLKIFLTALAVIDDLGAILVIAIFYTKTIFWTNLGIALFILLLLFLLGRLKVKNLLVYLIGGGVMWYFMLHSGIHATITGVLLAFVIPNEKIKKKSPSDVLQHLLHKPVAFYILPLFALANTAIFIDSNTTQSITENYSLGIALGLIIGKPLGIVSFCFIAVKIGISKLPTDLSWKSIIGVGFLGGIGFTMSIFITLLAFDNQIIINNAKFIVLISSLFAGLIGFLLLKFSLKGTSKNLKFN
jgi:Na+:H+ antiporter, NhaA family